MIFPRFAYILIQIFNSIIVTTLFDFPPNKHLQKKTTYSKDEKLLDKGHCL